MFVILHYTKQLKMKKEEKLIEAIKLALDGRTQRWLSLNAKIPESELSRKMKGNKEFLDSELERINALLKTNFTN